MIVNERISDESIFQVYWCKTIYHLVDREDRVKFTRALYRVSRNFKNDDNHDFRNHRLIKDLRKSVSDHTHNAFNSEFKSKSNHDNRKHKLDSSEESSEASASTADEEFQVDGYELLPEIIEKKRRYLGIDIQGISSDSKHTHLLTNIWQLPPHVHRMRRRGDPSGNVFIMKEFRRDSNEVEILEYLRTAKPASAHIITLMETVQTSIGECMVFPERGSVYVQLSFFTDGGRLRGHFIQLSHDLLQALAFLHENNIAHLDIKPRNLLFTNDVRLQITDFDVAVQVKSSDDKIDDYRGSKGWMAPEIGDEDGPRRLYNPFKADKWSCGCVLSLFAKRHGEPDENLETLAEQLMNENPERRPPLLNWWRKRQKDNPVGAESPPLFKRPRLTKE